MPSPPPHTCDGCATLPLAPSGPRTLYLAPPISDLLDVFERMASDVGLACERPFRGALAITIPDQSALVALAAALSAALSVQELAETLALTVPVGAASSLADFVRARPLSRLLAQARGRWFSDMLAEGRLVTHFQPIVSSQTPTRVVGHECLTRGRLPDGALVAPRDLFQTAIDTGLLYYLDRAARTGAVSAAAEHGVFGTIFINFRPSAIYNPAFCLATTVRAVAKAGLAPDRVVFEVVESEDINDTRHLVAILDAYRDAGFRVALDDLGSGYGSLKLLHRLQPDFVKLDMDLIRNVDRDPAKATIAAKLLETAADLRIPSIAEGVETSSEAEWVREHGATYQQGYFHGAPAATLAAPQARSERRADVRIGPVD